MEGWKKALIAGSATAAAVMLLKGRHSLGMVLAGVSLAAVASEYPQQFARFRRKLPGYITKGVSFIDTASRLGERLAEAANGRTDWYEGLLRG